MKKIYTKKSSEILVWKKCFSTIMNDLIIKWLNQFDINNKIPTKLLIINRTYNFFFLQREKHFNDVKICLTEKKETFFTYFTHFFGVTFQSFIEFYKVLFRLPWTRTNDFWNICMQTIHKIYWKVPAETSLKIITSAFAANSSVSKLINIYRYMFCPAVTKPQNYVIYTGKYFYILMYTLLDWLQCFTVY